MLSRLKWDIAVIGLLVFAAVAYPVLRDPYVDRTDEEETRGSRPPDQTEGDVLLLLPDGPAAPADSFRTLDCSYGWFNSLWQFYGSFATALSRTLSPEFLAGRNVVIVPRRVARDMPSAGINALADFARDGGQVVLEQPGDGWQRLTGISTSGDPQPARKISSVEGLGVHGRLRNHLSDVPLAGSLQPSPGLDPWPEGSSLLEVDGQPGIVGNRLGEGIVYTFLFEFGCSVTALQQGHPDEAMAFGSSKGPDLLPSSDRVADERLLTNEIPYADLLEHAVFHQFAEVRPLPRLWPYPGAHAGALMVSHPTPDDVRPSLGYLDWGRKHDAPATVFVAPDRATSTELGVLRETDAEVGLLWVRGLDRAPATETFGIGALRPYARELSLAAQRSRLQGHLPDTAGDSSTRLIHTEEATHARGWATTFRQLAAAGFQVDTSFGPRGAEQWGYLFGTGFPFYPVDRRGLPLPVAELPFVLRGANIQRDRLRSMLDASEDYYHQSLHVSVPSDAMVDEPSPGILTTYRDIFELARQRGHWVTSIGQFTRFLRSRRRSVLTSQWEPDEHRLTVSVDLLGTRSPTLEGGAIPGIAVPRTFDTRPIERIVVDGDRRNTADLAISGPGFEKIIRLEPGRHTVSVFYERPTTDRADAGTSE